MTTTELIQDDIEVTVFIRYNKVFYPGRELLEFFISYLGFKKWKSEPSFILLLTSEYNSFRLICTSYTSFIYS